MTSKTVFVLGAGFTRAFYPEMPLLIDNKLVEPLRVAARGLPTASAVLEAEIRLAGGTAVNVERLMTRLDSGTPFDEAGRTQAELSLLLATLRTEFVQRIRDARNAYREELRQDLLAFAGALIERQITCITLNYDDALDEQLAQAARNHGRPMDIGWDPEWGYGVPLRPPNWVMGGDETPESRNTLLLKLHGSMNWRVRRGYVPPYPLNAVVHVSPWADEQVSPSNDYEPFLESDPLIIPPVMLKNDLPAQPLFRAIWARARDELRRATRIVFIGYSMPVTDLAVRALFAESVSPRCRIQVVDLGRGTGSRRRLQDAYGAVFPGDRLGNSESWKWMDASSWARGFVREDPGA